MYHLTSVLQVYSDYIIQPYLWTLL